MLFYRPEEKNLIRLFRGARSESGFARIGGGPSLNQINQEIKKGQTPSSLLRVDRGVEAHGEQIHAHFDDGSALNIDGSWKHGGRELYGEESLYLRKHGWDI